MSFRRAGSQALGNTARTWKNFQIALGRVDFAKASTTFSTNYAAPTNVYSGAVNFPVISGTSWNPTWGRFGKGWRHDIRLQQPIHQRDVPGDHG